MFGISHPLFLECFYIQLIGFPQQQDEEPCVPLVVSAHFKALQEQLLLNDELKYVSGR